MGTLKNIPVIPQIDPHIESAINVAKELMFNELPISLGSKIFPIRTCIVPTNTRTNTKG